LGVGYMPFIDLIVRKHSGIPRAVGDPKHMGLSAAITHVGQTNLEDGRGIVLEVYDHNQTF
jgi:hypothetical protein